MRSCLDVTEWVRGFALCVYAFAVSVFVERYLSGTSDRCINLFLIVFVAVNPHAYLQISVILVFVLSTGDTFRNWKVCLPAQGYT